MSHLPQEIHDQITANLPPVDALAGYQVLRPQSQDLFQHARAWARIFKRSDWLEAAVSVGAHPVLVGHGVRQLYDDELSSDEPVYVFLLSLDWTGDLVL